MAHLSDRDSAAGGGEGGPAFGVRRQVTWAILIALALGPPGARPAFGQFSGSGWSAPSTGGVPIVLAEGGLAPLAVPLGGSVVGLAVFDILTAAGSAQSVNARRYDNFKSPETAVGVSLTATAVPLAVGLAGQTEFSALLVVGGIVLGPSAGHLYAGRVGRGLVTAGLRAGLGFLGMVALFSG